MRLLIALLLATLMFSSPAHAEFIISSAILEFTTEGPRQQDIELISRTPNSNDYVVSDVSEILNPDSPTENRQLLEDPAAGGLLVTPDKTILPGGSRKLLRFVLLRTQDEQEHIYRVTVKPVIKGIDANSNKLGLKVLVGYEVLVIVRPALIASGYTASRHGKTVTIINTGNTNLVFQNGRQCVEIEICKAPPTARIYPGHSVIIELPQDRPVIYSVWDGRATDIKILD
jgi:P pilus assembly chaperone PapD